MNDNPKNQECTIDGKKIENPFEGITGLDRRSTPATADKPEAGKDEKLRTFHISIEGGQWDWMLGGELDQALGQIQSFMDEMENGEEELVFKIKRQDMTRSEMDSLPEV